MDTFEEDLFGAVAVEFESKELAELYKDIAQYETLLNEVESSSEERDAIIESLDARWPYLRTVVQVSGNVIVPAQNNPNDPESITYDLQYVDSTSVESFGFNIMKIVNDQGDIRQVIGHALVFKPEETLKLPYIRTYTVKNGFAPIDNVVMTYPFESTEALQDKIHYRFPDLASEIDKAIIEAPDESEAVRALASIEIPVGIHDTIEGLSVISKYVSSLLTFDTQVPYQLEYDGRCYEVEPHTSDLLPANVKHGSALAYPLQVDIVPKNNDVDVTAPVTMGFGVRVNIVRLKPSLDTGKQYVIPITSSFDMYSLRPLIYAAINSSKDDA